MSTKATDSAFSMTGPHVSVPPLEPGDRLSRDEFERRYAAMPQLKKAELIEGVVYMPSPVRYAHHGRPHADLVTWLNTYRAATPHVGIGDNTTIRLDLDNEPQPDVLLLLEPGFGGTAVISADDYVENAPELVAEVASSSVSFDLHTKLHVYRRNAVKEYVVWRVDDQEIDWFVLRGSEYAHFQPGPDGLVRSEVFPGLWLDRGAMVAGDLRRVIAALHAGIASAEHAAFVQRLQSPSA